MKVAHAMKSFLCDGRFTEALKGTNEFEPGNTVSLLLQLHKGGWEEAEASVTLSPPPPLIHHLYVGDHVIRIERYLIISLY